MPTTTFAINTASTSNATSYASGSFTPAANDLLVVFVVASGTTSQGAMTDSQSLGWYLAGTSVYTASGNTIYMFVAEKLAAASSMTVTFDCSDHAAATGAAIEVIRVAGMTLTGAAAVLQTGWKINSGIGTPAMSFINNANTSNTTLGVVGSGTNPAALTPPTSWTELSDSGYATPTVGVETVARDGGFTSTTITWGSSTATSFGGFIAELDSSASSNLVQSKSSRTMPTTTTGTVVFDQNVTVGNTIVIATNDNWGAINQVSGITDSLGNAYTRATSASESSFVDGEVWVAPVTTGGACTITVTISNAGATLIMTALEYTGLASSPVDKTSSSSAVSGTAVTSGATATTTQASEVVVTFGLTNGTVATRATQGAGYNHDNNFIDTTNDLFIAFADKVVSSTGAQTGTFTLSGSGHWVGMVVTLKISTGPPPAPIGKNVGVLNNNFGAYASQAVNRAGTY